MREHPLLHGIDVSLYQGRRGQTGRYLPNIDWAAVNAGGIRGSDTEIVPVSFVIIKASQRERDPLFVEHWNGARGVGLKVGPYHYLDASMPIAQQIDLFLETYRAVDGFADIPPALDVEEVARGESPESLVARALGWLWAVEGELGIKPLIYTTPSFAETHFRGPRALDLAAHPLWIAHVGVSHPTVPHIWGQWSLWQRSWTGKVDGVHGDVDLDCLRPEMVGLALKESSG